MFKTIRTKTAKFLDIWKQIEYWKSPLKQVIAFILFWVMFGAAYHSVEMGLVFLASMYAHEAGHAYVYRVNGIKNRVRLLFPLGAVAAPESKDEDVKSDKLPWNNVGWITQAGLIGNVILMFVGLGFKLIPLPFTVELGKNIVAANVYLAVFNLLPVWNLDAGLLFKVVFSSLGETGDKIVAWLITLIGAAAILVALINSGGPWQVLINLVSNMGWIAFAIVVTIGVIRKSTKDDPSYYLSTQAMRLPQVVIQLLAYLGVCLITLIFLMKLM